MQGYSPTVVELGREREKIWTKENSGHEKHKRFPSSWTNSQQAQLCFLYIALFGLCQKYVPQDKHIFIIQQGFWYFENEVSSITNKGLLSGVCHHMGLTGRGRERKRKRERAPSACTQDYGHSGSSCSPVLVCSVHRTDVQMTCEEKAVSNRCVSIFITDSIEML